MDATADAAESNLVVQVFLTPHGDAAEGRVELDRCVHRWLLDSRLTSSARSTVSVGRRVHDPARRILEEKGYQFEDQIGTYVEVEIHGVVRDDASADLATDLAAIVASMSRVLDARRCRMAAGRVDIVRPGGGPIVLLHWLRKRPDFTDAEFHSYWSGGHTRHSQRLDANFGYRQLHVDAEWTAGLAGAVGLPAADFDGVAMTRSIDLETYSTNMTSASASKGMGDNSTFVDVGRSPYSTLWELEVVSQ